MFLDPNDLGKLKIIHVWFQKSKLKPNWFLEQVRVRVPIEQVRVRVPIEQVRV